jgi:soluble lytic murein transglycosylase-like protein
MYNEDFLSSAQHQDREAGQASGCLSVLLFPPVSVLLFGGLLLWGLLRLPFSVFLTERQERHPSPIAAFFTPQVQRWAPQISAWAAEHELDPNLVATVMQIESCGDPKAVSRAGAQGLFQVMPYHFANGENGFKPDTNALRGLDYLRRSLEHFDGNASLALAGYNGGLNGASRPAAEWAQETRDYMYWGEHIYADAAAGRSESAALAEWLAAGGASLCLQAEQRQAAQLP